jgi:hypothetical protein
MKFNDVHIFKTDRFSVGVEQESGKFFLSIPVANRLVDYEEYYEIDQATFDQCPANVAELRTLAQRCRLRQNDNCLMVQPGSDRGSAI